MNTRSGGACAALGALLFSFAVQAAPGLAGRWEGEIAIPGAPQPLVIDIEQDKDGSWTGSAILPGRGVKGAPLGALAIEGDGLKFELAAALPYAGEAPPAISARLDGADRLRGEFHLAGLTAPLTLQRRGAAQVDRPAPSQRLPAALLGSTWTGRYELSGVVREVTLTLATEGAHLRIARPGRTTEVPFNTVRTHGAFLGLSGNEYDISLEGDVRDAQFQGTFLQGALELPLELKRSGGK